MALILGAAWLAFGGGGAARAACTNLAADDVHNVPPIGQFLCRDDVTGAVRLRTSNNKASAVLSQLDIDGDGVSDGAADTDGDGLADNWEIGGPAESASLGGGVPDRFVNFSAPTAIGPGTPPTFVLNRQAVQTQTLSADTDQDGLTDFVEVFGLKYIDDNGNGRLDFQSGMDFADENSNGRWDPGEPVFGTAEWLDLNDDGLPSIGELPLHNLFGTAAGTDRFGNNFVFVMDDCDGDFVPRTVRVVWNVPQSEWVLRAAAGCASSLESAAGPIQGTLPADVRDDDGDGIPDAAIADDGTRHTVFQRLFDFDGFMFTDPTLSDTDGDGLLDGVDPDPLINPQTFGVPSTANQSFQRVGVDAANYDVDNDGLGNGSDFANDITGAVDFPTDISDLMQIFRADLLQLSPPVLPESLIEDLIGADWDGSGLFRLTDQRDFELDIRRFLVSRPELFTVGARNLFAENPAVDYTQTGVLRTNPADLAFGRRAVGMGAQLLLVPAGPSTFTPDPRIWTILYAWRMPGFDADGDGFLGKPESRDFRLDDPRGLVSSAGTDSGLDGQISAPSCGLLGGASLSMSMLGLALFRLVVPRRRRSGA